jgi:hypothetical protein
VGTDETRLAEVRRAEVRTAELRLDKVRIGEVRYDPEVPLPPLIPPLDALFQNGKMFSIGHDSSMPATSRPRREDSLWRLVPAARSNAPN